MNESTMKWRRTDGRTDRQTDRPTDRKNDEEEVEGRRRPYHDDVTTFLDKQKKSQRKKCLRLILAPPFSS
mgnify:CR=1 FL=1